MARIGDTLAQMSLGMLACFVLSLVLVVLGVFIGIGGLIFWILSLSDDEHAETSRDAGYIMLLLGGVLWGIALPFLCLSCWRCCKKYRKIKRRDAEINEEISTEMNAFLREYIRERELRHREMAELRQEGDMLFKDGAGPADKKELEASASHVQPNAPPMETNNQPGSFNTSEKEMGACSAPQVEVSAPPLDILNAENCSAATAPPDWKQYQ